MTALLRVINIERLALTASLLLLIWQGVYSAELVKLVQQPIPFEVAQSVPIVHEFPQIAAFHVFGLYVPKAPRLQETDLSNLNFTVSGIFLADPINESTALIDTGNGKSKMVKIGDVLQNDITLYKMTEDAVIVERNGHYESIPLDKSTLKFDPPADPLIWNNRD